MNDCRALTVVLPDHGQVRLTDPGTFRADVERILREGTDLQKAAVQRILRNQAVIDLRDGVKVALSTVLDVTGSMGPWINGAKSVLTQLYQEVQGRAAANQWPLRLEFNLLAFRDLTEGEPIESVPYVDDASQVIRTLGATLADGGGPYGKESGLDALALLLGMVSPNARGVLVTGGFKQPRRDNRGHVVVLATDEEAYTDRFSYDLVAGEIRRLGMQVIVAADHAYEDVGSRNWEKIATVKPVLDVKTLGTQGDTLVAAVLAAIKPLLEKAVVTAATDSAATSTEMIQDLLLLAAPKDPVPA